MLLCIIYSFWGGRQVSESSRQVQISFYLSGGQVLQIPNVMPCMESAKQSKQPCLGCPFSCPWAANHTPETRINIPTNGDILIIRDLVWISVAVAGRRYPFSCPRAAHHLPDNLSNVSVQAYTWRPFNQIWVGVKWSSGCRDMGSAKIGQIDAHMHGQMDAQTTVHFVVPLLGFFKTSRGQ